MIKNIKNTWIFPDDGLVKIQTTSTTDAEGTICINSDNVGSEITTITPEIYLVAKNDIENNKYVISGADLYDPALFETETSTCNNLPKFDFVFKTRDIPAIATGNFYIVKCDIDSKVKIDFIIIIKDIEE